MSYTSQTLAKARECSVCLKGRGKVKLPLTLAIIQFSAEKVPFELSLNARENILNVGHCREQKGRGRSGDKQVEIWLEGDQTPCEC